MPLADLNNVTIRYELEGPPAAPVAAFSNSLGADLSMWDAQASALTPHLRVLRYDNRGHGRSSAPERPYTIPELGTDLLNLLDFLRLDTVSFCGLSMGGLIGMWLATKASHRFDRIILSNTAAKIGDKATWSSRTKAIESSGLPAIADGLMQRWFTPSFLQNPVHVSTATTMFLSTSQTGYLACCDAISHADFRSSLSSIALPTLILAGMQDQVTTLDDARFLQQTIPGAQLSEVAGAHLANLESPASYTDVIRRFLLNESPIKRSPHE